MRVAYHPSFTPPLFSSRPSLVAAGCRRLPPCCRRACRHYFPRRRHEEHAPRRLPKPPRHTPPDSFSYVYVAVTNRLPTPERRHAPPPERHHQRAMLPPCRHFAPPWPLLPLSIAATSPIIPVASPLQSVVITMFSTLARHCHSPHADLSPPSGDACRCRLRHASCLPLVVITRSRSWLPPLQYCNFLTIRQIGLPANVIHCTSWPGNGLIIGFTSVNYAAIADHLHVCRLAVAFAACHTFRRHSPFYAIATFATHVTAHV